MQNTFTNTEVSIEALPQYQEVTLNSVSLNLRKKLFFQNALILFFLALGGVMLFYFEPDKLNIVIGIAIAFILLTLRFLDISLKQKRYGYALREKDLLFQSGYLINRTIIIPYNRIQHLTIHRSLWDKQFGISSLNVFTAGGDSSDVKIPGLDPDLAAQINEMITQKISEND